MSASGNAAIVLCMCGTIYLLFIAEAKMKNQIRDQTILTVSPTFSNPSQLDTRINNNQGDDLQLKVGMKTPLRVCTQMERLNQMKKICHFQNTTKQMSPHHALVDDKHRTLACLMDKAGCTAFKALFLEANGYNISASRVLSGNLIYVHGQSTLEKVGLHYLDSLPEDKQALALKRYFKFSVVRHPFERLLSVFRGKVLDAGSEFSWFVDILNTVQPDLFKNKNFTLMREIEAHGRNSKSQLEQRKTLREPTFAEFLIWMKETVSTNIHFADYQRLCGYCGQDWDAIIHLETLDEDKDIVLKALNYDVKDIPVRHSHQREGKVKSHFSTIIAQFSDVSDDVLDYFLDKYAVDMEMFGYKWNRQSNKAYCRIKIHNGFCC